MAYNCNSSVLDYIANLNAIPPQEMQSPSNEHFSMDDDLAMFSNVQFFDLGINTNIKSVTGFEVEKDSNMPLQGVGDYSYADVNGYSKVYEPLGPNHESISAHSKTSSAFNGESPAVGRKRKLNVLAMTSNGSSPSVSETAENSRQAAEEDKRRRNTAASARFRVKKKQREQALEKNAREMSDKVTTLENRIRMLETENKWLKDLITEKNDGKERDIGPELNSLWKQFEDEVKTVTTS